MTSMERAFTQMPETFKELGNLQTALKEMRGVRVEDLIRLDKLKTLIEQGPRTALEGINLDTVRRLFLDKELMKGINKDTAENLLKGLIQEPTGEDVEGKIAELTDILSTMMENAGDAILAFSAKTREAAKPLEQSIIVGNKLAELASSADQAKRALDDLQGVSGVFDNISAAMGEGPKGIMGSRAPTIFSGARGGKPSDAVPVSFAGLSELDIERRMIQMLSSSEVRRGTRVLFDQSFKRLSPISDEERDKRLKALQVKQQKANLAQSESKARGELQLRKQSNEEFLQKINRIIKLPFTPKETKQELESIKRELINFGKIDASRLVTAGGGVNRRVFRPLDRLSDRFDAIVAQEDKRLLELAKQDPDKISQGMRQVLEKKGLISGELSKQLMAKEGAALSSPVTTALSKNREILKKIEENTAVMAGIRKGGGKTDGKQPIEDQKRKEMLTKEALELKRKDPVAYFKKFFPNMPELAKNAEQFIKKGFGLDRFVSPLGKEKPKADTVKAEKEKETQQKILEQTKQEARKETSKWRSILTKPFAGKEVEKGKLPAKPIKRRFIPGLPGKRLPPGMTLRGAQRLELAEDYGGEALISGAPQLKRKVVGTQEVIRKGREPISIPIMGRGLETQEEIAARRRFSTAGAALERSGFDRALAKAATSQELMRLELLQKQAVTGFFPDQRAISGIQRIGEQIETRTGFREPEDTQLDVLNKALMAKRETDRLILPKKEQEEVLNRANARDPQQNKVVQNLENLNAINQTQLKETSRATQQQQERRVEVEASAINDALTTGADKMKEAMVSAGSEIASNVANAVSSAVNNSGNNRQGRNQSTAADTDLQTTLNNFIDTQKSDMLQQLNRIEVMESKLGTFDGRIQDAEVKVDRNVNSIGNLTTITTSTNQVVELLAAQINSMQTNIAFNSV